MTRYSWGRRKGYQHLKDRELVPPPVMSYPDRWRVDQLLAWEEKRTALAEAALEAFVAPDREPTCVTNPLPSPSDGPAPHKRGNPDPAGDPGWVMMSRCEPRI